MITPASQKLNCLNFSLFVGSDCHKRRKRDVSEAALSDDQGLPKPCRPLIEAVSSDSHLLSTPDRRKRKLGTTTNSCVVDNRNHARSVKQTELTEKEIKIKQGANTVYRTSNSIFPSKPVGVSSNWKKLVKVR